MMNNRINNIYKCKKREKYNIDLINLLIKYIKKQNNDLQL